MPKKGTGKRSTQGIATQRKTAWYKISPWFLAVISIIIFSAISFKNGYTYGYTIHCPWNVYTCSFEQFIDNCPEYGIFTDDYQDSAFIEEEYIKYLDHIQLEYKPFIEEYLSNHSTGYKSCLKPNYRSCSQIATDSISFLNDKTEEYKESLASRIGEFDNVNIVLPIVIIERGSSQSDPSKDHVRGVHNWAVLFFEGENWHIVIDPYMRPVNPSKMEIVPNGWQPSYSGD